MPEGDTERQAQLTMTGETHLDEHGEHDEWGRGGVYDAAGRFDLDATRDLLAERFEPVAADLPDGAGPFERQHTGDPLNAYYETNEEYETVVRIFPRGPHLHEWTVAVTEYGPPVLDDPPAETGYRSSAHYTVVSDLDQPETAAEMGAEWMRGYDPDEDSKIGGGRDA
jgi:hypothetical protein